MANDFYSDDELAKLFGKRVEAVSLFSPQELGWACPVDPKHEIEWSEFCGHIWCYTCRKDYFSLLCPKQLNPFTTAEILKKELATMKPLMAQWTLEKYKNYYETKSKQALSPNQKRG